MVTYEQTVSLLKVLETYFKGRLSDNPDKVKIWHDKIKYYDLDKCKQAVNKLNEEARRKKTKEYFYVPALNEFVSAYNRIDLEIKANEPIREETTCCDRGFRYFATAYKNGKFRPLNKITGLCKDDEPGTQYPKFSTERFPCKCTIGKKLNSIEASFGYDHQTLIDAFEVNFSTESEAREYLTKAGITVS